MATKKNPNDIDSKMVRQATRSIGGGMANAFDAPMPIDPLVVKLKKAPAKKVTPKSAAPKAAVPKPAVLKPDKIDLPKALKGLRGPRGI